MRIQRVLPPAAVPIRFRDLFFCLAAWLRFDQEPSQIEARLRELFRVKHVFCVSSGKAALTLLLIALSTLSPRRKVLIPAYTCFSVPSAIVKAGLRVSLCDIDPRTLDFDYQRLKLALDDDTLCVVPTHLFGLPSDVERAKALCQDRGSYVVEDAAQAMGVEQDGKYLGTIGDVGFYSLGRGKNLTCGSGGIIVTNSDEIARAIARQHQWLPESNFLDDVKDFLRLVFMRIFLTPSLYWLPVGVPMLKLGQTFFSKEFPVTRFSKLKAAFLTRLIAQLKQANQVRTRVADNLIKKLPEIAIPKTAGPYLRLPVLLRDREERERILRLGREKGLGISRMYPSPINEIEEIRVRFVNQQFPSASLVADRLLTIPLHQLVTGKDQQLICELFTMDTAAVSQQPEDRTSWARSAETKPS